MDITTTSHDPGYGPGHPSTFLPSKRVGRFAGKVRALVLTGPGINCDRETAEACQMAGAEAERVHLNQLLSGERRLVDFSLIVLPGGFSYGDHLGAGAMLATVLRYRLMEDLLHVIADGRPVLGICNGFQVLARLGLLGEIALVPNEQTRFDCRWVHLRVEPSTCIFLRGLETIDLPVAHGQGRVIVSDDQLPALLLRAPLRYKENPNGSVADIAGVCNDTGNVLGLMPHPERSLDNYHRPGWSAGAWKSDRAGPLGLAVFQNAVTYVRREL